jgi:hypothetical protein
MPKCLNFLSPYGSVPLQSSHFVLFDQRYKDLATQGWSFIYQQISIMSLSPFEKAFSYFRYTCCNIFELYQENRKANTSIVK